MKKATATTVRNVTKKLGVPEDQAELMVETLEILSSKQPNGVLNITKENRDEISKQMTDLAFEIEAGRENKSKTFLLLQRWENEFYDFFVEQTDLLMNKKANSLETKDIGFDFLKSVYANAEDILTELYLSSLVISNFDGKKIRPTEFENVFGEGFKYEPYYKDGEKGIVKHLDDISHIHIMPVMVPHEPVVFPITSYDTVIRVEYNAILKTKHGNFHLRIELSDLNLEALKFTFVVY